TFHSSIVRESDGTIKAWGQGIGHTGLASNPAGGAPVHTGNVLRPQEISVANGYDFTGNILHFTGGSRVEGSQQQQFALLTTTGLYIWGIPGTLVSTD